MYFSIFFGIMFFVLLSIDIPVPHIINQKDLKDITVITDTVLAQTFYGVLKDFPHTYEIRALHPFTLTMQILLPDIHSSKNNVSGIIIKEQKRGQRVEEIARLPSKDAEWKTTYEPYGRRK